MFATFILVLPCGFDTLKYSWVKATVGICTLTDYSVARKRQHRRGVGSGLSLGLPLLARGVRGGSNGLDVHHGDEAGTPRITKAPFLTRHLGGVGANDLGVPTIIDRKHRRWPPWEV
jgi:hypothetical protein